jgi:hypothetical protein
MISHGRLLELLDYDGSTGIFTWRIARGRASAGSVAGRTSMYGYIEIGLDDRLYKAHRLAWLHVHGTTPDSQIDHINGIRSDNRIANLREASAGQNQHNRGPQWNNKSGFKGVSWNTKRKKWCAQIRFDWTTQFLGYFDDANEAARAYDAAALKLHGEFCTLNNLVQEVIEAETGIRIDDLMQQAA